MNKLLLTAALCFPVAARAKIEYVLHITCDGLRGDALKAAMDLPANAAAYPGFRQLMAQGAATFQARCDFDYSETIPNHTGVVTGRPVSEPAGFTPAAFTADPATDVITAAAHGLNEGDNVLLATTGTLPGGGHTVSWNSTAWIEQGTKVVDGYLKSILDAVTGSAVYRGKVAIIVTADHGGGTATGTGNSHADASAIPNINIPLFLWGPGIPGNIEAYALFKNRTDPGTAGRPNSAPGTAQPLRNTDTANIAMTFLGLPAVTGSYFRPELQDALTITQAGGGIVLTWPLYLTGHILHSTPSPADEWMPAKDVPVETSGEFQVTIPLQRARRFFGLKAPQ